jgi:hypothetical protein
LGALLIALVKAAAAQGDVGRAFAAAAATRVPGDQFEAQLLVAELAAANGDAALLREVVRDIPWSKTFVVEPHWNAAHAGVLASKGHQLPCFVNSLSMAVQGKPLWRIADSLREP